MPRDNRPPGGPPRQFNFVRRTADDLNNLLNRQQSRFDSTIEGARFFYPKSGENVVRILPPTWEATDTHYALAVWEHRYVGVHNSHYLCLQRMLHKRCPICEEERALKLRNPEQATKLAAMQRYYVYVLDRLGQNKTEPLVWNTFGRQNRAVLLQTKSSRGDVFQPEDPKRGRDLLFVKSGSGLHTEYDGYKFDIETSPMLDDPVARQALIDHLLDHPLPSLLHYKTAEYLEEILLGTAAEPDAELDEPEPEPQREAPRSRAAAVRAAAVDEDEDDADSPLPDHPVPNGEQDDEDEEDEDEARPADQDEDEDDEEEAAAPEPEVRQPPRRRPEPEPEVRARNNNGRERPPLRAVPSAPRQQPRGGAERTRPGGSRFRD